MDLVNKFGGVIRNGLVVREEEYPQTAAELRAWVEGQCGNVLTVNVNPVDFGQIPQTVGPQPPGARWSAREWRWVVTNSQEPDPALREARCCHVLALALEKDLPSSLCIWRVVPTLQTHTDWMTNLEYTAVHLRAAFDRDRH